MRQGEPANHVKMDSAHRNYIICSIELAPGRAVENHLDDSRRDGMKESATAKEKKENANADCRTSVHFLRRVWKDLSSTLLTSSRPESPEKTREMGTPRWVGAPRCALQEGRLFEKEMAWTPLKMSLFLPYVFLIMMERDKESKIGLHYYAFSETRTTIRARLWMCTTKIICHTLTVQKHSYARKSHTKPNRKFKKI